MGDSNEAEVWDGPEPPEEPEATQQNQQMAPKAKQTKPAPPPWWEALAADTPEDEIHERQAYPVRMKDGKPVMLKYVTARFVQERLDTAVGPANWKARFDSLPTGAVRCGISIKDPMDPVGEWVEKWDVGTPSSIEADKGAHSDAFKRAGVMWGIARDLYDERDERDAEQPAQPQAQQQRQPIQQRVQPQPVIEEAGDSVIEFAEPEPQQPNRQQPVSLDALDGNTVGWACPVHGVSRLVPPGISKKTGKPYKAFYACSIAGCDEKQPFQR